MQLLGVIKPWIPGEEGVDAELRGSLHAKELSTRGGISSFSLTESI